MLNVALVTVFSRIFDLSILKPIVLVSSSSSRLSMIPNRFDSGSFDLKSEFGNII